jgi:hypothetical protein
MKISLTAQQRSTVMPHAIQRLSASAAAGFGVRALENEPFPADRAALALIRYMATPAQLDARSSSKARI